jgi:hypothetical protein
MDEDIPEGIGPHEGRELDLMLAGEKPLAMFNDDIPADMKAPEIAFDPYVSDGRFIKQEVTLSAPGSNDGGLRYYFYALPGEEWRLRRIIEIQKAFFEDNAETTPELETEIGRLLGYDESDIQTFVRRWFLPPQS